MMRFFSLFSVQFATLTALSFTIAPTPVSMPFERWSREEAQELLNDSPWADQQTEVRVLTEVGSGVFGEKEIYSRFFVRFLSAEPVRKAYARLEQIRKDYDQLDRADKALMDDRLSRKINVDVSDWIVVAVSLRSNDPEVEQRFWSTLQRQTVQTLKSRATLSTGRFPRVEISAYFPPRELAIGGVFVFPRRMNGEPIVSSDDSFVVFELDLPGNLPEARVRFLVGKMIIDGKVVI